MEDSEGAPKDVNCDFTVRIYWPDDYCSSIIREAMAKLRHGEPYISKDISHCLLGSEVSHPIPYGMRTLPIINHQPQVSAIEGALQRPITLIQGHPRMGTASISCAIVHHLMKQSEISGQKFQMLVCAHWNDVVNPLARQISNTGLKVVRLCARYLEVRTSSIQDLTLHYQARNKLETPGDIELARLWDLNEKCGLSEEDQWKFKKLKGAAETEILKKADVVCCTCYGAGDVRLEGITFPKVIIDEAQDASKAVSVIPLVRGCQQAILIGDLGILSQLGPVDNCKKAAHHGDNFSLFEHLIQLGEKPILAYGA